MRPGPTWAVSKNKIQIFPTIDFLALPIMQCVEIQTAGCKRINRFHLTMLLNGLIAFLLQFGQQFFILSQVHTFQMNAKPLFVPCILGIVAKKPVVVELLDGFFTRSASPGRAR
jgi:hypothetical protein